jgi:hypothetical protein
MFSLHTDIQRLKRLFAFIVKPKGARVPMVVQIQGRSEQRLFQMVTLGGLSSFHRSRQIKLV